ncbi:copper resistance CopC family protein [Salicibibacter kimchii]|uniref:Copper resistance protein CopC n=1 Tax=Salicibibacter kimchii TaxID=2099786 RepID=A0A345BZP4_9BACI|nr:copper resistance CopC family protein [Salicibibacter kimchii]AXF56425.1 copper resistance protein CopC [Salicibibacter kimchii]
MKYFYIFIATFLMSLALASAAFAHAHPEDFNPKDGATVEEEVETITVFFDSGIESATTATVADDEGNEHELADETIEGNDYIATLQEPLPSGDYTVELTVLAEDGHTTEEAFTFSVDANEAVEEEDATEEEENGTEEAETVEDEAATEETSDEESAAAETAEGGDDGGAGGLLIGAIGIIIAGAIIFFIFRGRKAA